MENISFTVGNFPETWEKTDLFCPRCGAASVFEETFSVDPEYGSDHMCVSCGAKFCIPYGASVVDGETDLKRLENLRNPEQAQDIIHFQNNPELQTILGGAIKRLAMPLFSIAKELPDSKGGTIKWRRYSSTGEPKLENLPIDENYKSYTTIGEDE